MTRKCHDQTLQANPWHREKETNHNNSRMTARRQLRQNIFVNFVLANSADLYEIWQPHSVEFHLGLHCLSKYLLTGNQSIKCQEKHSDLVSIRLGIKGLLVPDSPPVESLCCVLEQEALSAAYCRVNQE